jgi:hypothetical protein
MPADCDKPVQIVPLNARDSDIVNMAAIAAYCSRGVMRSLVSTIPLHCQ